MVETNKKIILVKHLELIYNVMCDKYCKYPDHVSSYSDDPEVCQEYLLELYCNNCPLVCEV